MNRQSAYVSALSLPVHFHDPTSHHPHHLSQAFGECGALAPPASASFSGSLALPLPFRPAAAPPPPPTTAADLPVDYNNLNVGHHHHFARPPTTLRMAAFASQHDDELARLQELSNKWEPEATVC